MKIQKIILFSIIALIAGIYLYMNPLLPIITGYSAKNLASGIFVAGRTQQSLEKEDLHFSYIKFNHNKIDYSKKEVTSSFLWHTSKAVYIDGFGCSLVNDFKSEEMTKRSYQKINILPERPDTMAWPTGDKVTGITPIGVNMAKMNTVISKAFSNSEKHKGTFAVMVIYKGQPIIEKYRSDFNSKSLFLSWSMAKGITNALTGILVKEGKLNINKPVAFKEWENDDRKNITINNLMHMNSGLEWNENYGTCSDVNNMLHKEGDMGAFALSKKSSYPADSVWEYSSGSTNIISMLIRNTFGKNADYYSFPRKRLFNKIGMRSAIFEVDASGTFVGSSYLYATMRDYARFGLLYLNNGKWLSDQILPIDWVKYTTTEAKGSDGQYGAYFWLNKSGKHYPGVPRDMFYCCGHNGQYIYIIPSKQLVVVRTGFSPKGTYDFNEFLSGITSAVE